MPPKKVFRFRPSEMRFPVIWGAVILNALYKARAIYLDLLTCACSIFFPPWRGRSIYFWSFITQLHITNLMVRPMGPSLNRFFLLDDSRGSWRHTYRHLKKNAFTSIFEIKFTDFSLLTILLLLEVKRLNVNTSYEIVSHEIWISGSQMYSDLGPYQAISNDSMST